MLGRIAVNVLIGCGFVTAAITLGGLFVYGCSVLMWKRDERRAELRLAEIVAQEEARYRAEAQKLGLFAEQLEEIRNLPVANPWSVAE